MSTRAIPADTSSNGEAVGAGIRTVLPDVPTSTRSVFHLLPTPPYFPSPEWAIHCDLPAQST